MVDIIKKYNLNNILKYEFFKINHTIQNLICHNLFLIELKNKSEDYTITILNKIENKVINNNKCLTYYLDKEDRSHYLNKLIMFKYYMFCLIYDIQNIQSLFEIDFIKKEIYQVERYDYTDYDDFNNNFVIEDDYYNKKYNLFSKKHYIIKDLFNNVYIDMIESSYKNVYSECSNFIITNDSLVLTLYSSSEEEDDEIQYEIEYLIEDIIDKLEEQEEEEYYNNMTDEETINDIIDNIIYCIEETDYFDNL